MDPDVLNDVKLEDLNVQEMLDKTPSYYKTDAKANDNDNNKKTNGDKIRAEYDAKSIIDKHKFVKKTIALELRQFGDLQRTFRTTMDALGHHKLLLSENIAERFLTINNHIDVLRNELEELDHNILTKVEESKLTGDEKKRLAFYKSVDRIWYDL